MTARSRSLLIAAAVLMAACAPSAPPSATAGLTPSPVAATPAPVSPEELADAVRFRTTFGLRTDQVWISAVAADPAAEAGRQDFGVPLLPFERADLLNRPQQPEVARQIEVYGQAVPDDWAGVFMDQQAGGVLVAAFSDNVARHQQALTLLLPPGAQVEFRSVKWSREDLEAFGREVAADRAWFETIGAEFSSAYVMVTDNLLEVEFYGTAGAADGIADHFGSPPWLTTHFAGPRAWEGARGDVVVRLRGAGGDPHVTWYCQYAADDPAVNTSQAYGISGDTGECITEGLPAVPLTVTVEQHGGGPAIVRDVFQVVVIPNRTTTVERVID